MTKSRPPIESSWRTLPSMLLFAAAVALMLAPFPFAYALAEQDDSGLAAGETDYANGQEIQISYAAIDTVRYPSKFGGYPLPSPDNPLRPKGRVGDIPPAQNDIDRYYRDFDGYEFLGTDYSFGCLRYVYFWPQGETSREEAERIFEEEVASHGTDEEFEEEREFYAKVRELREAGDVEAAEKLENERAGIEPEPDGETITQEEMIEMSLNDTRQNLKDARKRGNKKEITQLERELAQKQADLASERVTATDMKEAADNDAEDERPAAVAIAAAASIAAAMAVVMSIHAKRKGDATEGRL